MGEINKKIQDIVVAPYQINVDNIDNWLSYPPKPEFGDYAFNIFEIAKILKRNPAEISSELKLEFSKFPDFFQNVSNMGGYVNFFITPKILLNEFQKFDINPKENKNETIIVDYIGANVGKPLHIGHLCTPSLGQSIINIHEYLGYNVISDSHFGDWGGIFGKLIFAYKLWGNEKKLKQNAINHLFELYVKINTEIELDIKFYEELTSQILGNLQKFGTSNIKGGPLEILFFLKENGDNKEKEISIHFLEEFKKFKNLEEQSRQEFKKLSEGNPEHIKLWQEFTKYSILATKKQLEEELGVKPKYNIGESFYEGLNLPRPNNEDYPELQFTMKDIVKILLDKKIASQNEDGSVGVVFPEETKLSSCVLQKKDGTGLYLTSDLAAIKYRADNWKPSKIIYFVDVRQQLHLKQAFYIAHKAWPELDKTELTHAYNGFIKLKEGAMSTRKGTVIFLKDLIDEGYKRTEQILKGKGRELSPENIKAISIAAIKYSYLSQDREKDIVFDWDKALSFEGNSGPYIQYAYVRASKILALTPALSQREREQDIELSQYDKSLIKKLLEFDAKVGETASKYKPHILAQYCYELASEFNGFYVHTPKILEEKDENLKNLRLNIIEKFTKTLKKGFELLAIEMPDEM